MIKKKIVLSIIIVGVVVVALLPLMLYGVSVSVAKTTIQLQVDSTNPTPGSSISPTALGFSGSIGDISFLPENISSYEYVFNKLSGGMAKASDATGTGNTGATVEIVIALILKTPSGRQLELNFSPNKLSSTGAKEVVVLLGPDELNRESGTFEMTLTITIKVTVPVVGNIVDLSLTPVIRMFQVPP